MGEDREVREAAALDEAEGGLAAEGSCGVGLAAPGGFELDGFEACEEEPRFLIFEVVESLDDGVLGPALRVSFGSVFMEMMEGFYEVWDEGVVIVADAEFCGFGDDEVVFVGEGFAERGIRSRRAGGR